MVAQRLSNTNRNNIIKNLLLEVDHRNIIQLTIDNLFLERVIDFFGQVTQAKLQSNTITKDWYKEIMISAELNKEDIAWNSGLAIKSISNIHKSTSKTVVIDAAREHYDELLQCIDSLIFADVDIRLTIKLKDVSVTLSLNESLIVINAIAVMRAGIRGGIWSTMGKQIEKPLVIMLCKLLQVESKYYQNKCIDNVDNPRESDFFLSNSDGECIRCEVKLMGNGNPESADGAMARNAKLFIADKLSDQNKHELDKKNIKWIAMADGNTLNQFSNRLTDLKIPNIRHDTQLSPNTILEMLNNIDHP